MTLDGAINHYKEEAEKYMEYGIETECYQCGKENEQLAEWLTELKDLREENKVLIQECDRLIKEKGELLSKVSGGDVLRICQLEEQLEKAKRLLKVAVDDINLTEACDTCEYHHANSDMCQKDYCYKWRYADEALKLLND